MANNANLQSKRPTKEIARIVLRSATGLHGLLYCLMGPLTGFLGWGKRGMCGGLWLLGEGQELSLGCGARKEVSKGGQTVNFLRDVWPTTAQSARHSCTKPPSCLAGCGCSSGSTGTGLRPRECALVAWLLQNPSCWAAGSSRHTL